MLNWLVEEKGIAASRRISLCSTSRSEMMAPSHAVTFDTIRQATSTTARAEGSSGRVAPYMRARHFCIVQASSTVMYAHSNPSAAQRNHHARSRATSMSTPETLPGLSRIQRPSSNHGVSARRSRCGCTLEAHPETRSTSTAWSTRRAG
jgi:hypothetical protein